MGVGALATHPSDGATGGGVSMGVDTKANTLWAVTHLSEVTALPLSASHSLVMPLVV